MEATYIGFNLWVKAVEKAKTTDTAKVIETLPGLEVPNLTGGTAKLLPNHHITKPVYIGEIMEPQFSGLLRHEIMDYMFNDPAMLDDLDYLYKSDNARYSPDLPFLLILRDLLENI